VRPGPSRKASGRWSAVHGLRGDLDANRPKRETTKVGLSFVFLSDNQVELRRRSRSRLEKRDERQAPGKPVPRPECAHKVASVSYLLLADSHKFVCRTWTISRRGSSGLWRRGMGPRRRESPLVLFGVHRVVVVDLQELVGGICLDALV
jgi:hypothetical protein